MGDRVCTLLCTYEHRIFPIDSSVPEEICKIHVYYLCKKWKINEWMIFKHRADLSQTWYPLKSALLCFWRYLNVSPAASKDNLVPFHLIHHTQCELSIIPLNQLEVWTLFLFLLSGGPHSSRQQKGSCSEVAGCSWLVWLQVVTWWLYQAKPPVCPGRAKAGLVKCDECGFKICHGTMIVLVHICLMSFRKIASKKLRKWLM